MPSSVGPNTVNDSIIFAYDVADTSNSYKGRPTDNLVANASLGVYNNVGGDVSITLTQTTEYYKGASIWKEVITATTSTGVSYLTNGNNPGIGVYHTGGGGLANRYTGHTIFFKPIGPMYSSPIYTNYSNITGWQSSTQYEDMRDGWYGANVLWYDTTTRTDNKYWAINPAGVVINVPITIYWAGPFKEDLNSTAISQFINGTRSVTGSLLDLSGANKSINVTNVSFNSNVQIVFDGSSDGMFTSQNNQFFTNTWTWEFIAKFTTNTGTYQGLVWAEGDTEGGYSGLQYLLSLYSNSYFHYRIYNASTGWTNTNVNITMTPTNYNHIVWQFEAGITKIYVNGSLFHSDSTRGLYTGGTNSPIWIGCRNDKAYSISGEIPISKFYNRLLGDSEVYNNYRSYKTRFNLS